jgi:hypothetical protein
VEDEVCPTDQHEIEMRIEERKIYTRGINWQFGIPLREAESWNCKFRIMAN